MAVTDAADDDVEVRRALEWLVWDLHLGRSPLPAAERYLDPVAGQVLDRIAALAARDRLIAGLDVYPVEVQPLGGAAPDWSTADRAVLAVDEMARWHDRYGVPFWVAETSNRGLPVTEQVPWLEHLVAGPRRLRAAGRPVRGPCWCSRSDQFDWQTALADPTGAVTEVGLFDVHRRPRPVAARFGALAGAPERPGPASTGS